MDEKKLESLTRSLLRLSLAVGIPLALLVGSRAIAWAELQYQNTWKSGDKLTAADLNARFDAVKDAVNKPNITLGPAQFGRTGKYLGKSGPTTGKWVSGALTGYAAGKKICENTFQSVTAHVCSADEIMQNASATPEVFSTGQAWIVGGTMHRDGIPTSASKPEDLIMQNCTGWTSNVGHEDAPDRLYHYAGPVFNNNGQGAFAPGREFCDQSFPIHCCD